MMGKQEDILRILNDLLQSDDVLACMLATKGLQGLVPKNIKVTDVNFWKLLHNTTDEFFKIINSFYDYGLERLYFELGKYTIIIAPISQSFSLIVVIPSLANMGLVDVEIENSKRKIKEVVEDPHG